MDSKVKVSCISCKKTEEVSTLKDEKSPQKPGGWRKTPAGFLCNLCWKDQFVPRTILIPVASVELVDKEKVSAEECWKQFRAACRVSWREAAQVANWLMTELRLSDREPLVLKAKAKSSARKKKVAAELTAGKPLFGLPKWKDPPHLQAMGVSLFKVIDSQTYYSLYREMVAKYREARFGIRVLYNDSLPGFRDGELPFMVPAKDLVLTFRKASPANGKKRQGRSTVYARVRISGQRFLLRLRGGSDWWRQIAALEKIQIGDAVKGDVELLDRGKDVMLAFSVWLRKEKPAQFRQGVLAIETSPREHGPGLCFCEGKLAAAPVNGSCPGGKPLRLMTCLLSDSKSVWNLNEDQILRWVTEHSQALQRLREDAKFERKLHHWVARFEKEGRGGTTVEGTSAVFPSNMAQYREVLCRRYHNRMKNACHQISTMLARLAWRLKVSVVRYNDLDHGWCEQFRWFDLKNMLKDKLAKLNIQFEDLKEANPVIAR